MVPSGRNREAKPSTAHPLSLFPSTLRLCQRRHSILPLPRPFNPHDYSISLSIYLSSFPHPRQDIISPGREPIYLQTRGVQVLSRLETNFKLDTAASTMVHCWLNTIAKYRILFARNRLRRTICGWSGWCLSIGRMVHGGGCFKGGFSRYDIEIKWT